MKPGGWGHVAEGKKVFIKDREVEVGGGSVGGREEERLK